jgi:hypothetical protein
MQRFGGDEPPQAEPAAPPPPPPPPPRAKPSESSGGGDTPAPPQAQTSSSRRGFIGAILAVGVALFVGQKYLSPGKKSLPEPKGQEMGMDYRAATLAAKAAPTLAMPDNVNSWEKCGAGSSGALKDMDLVLAVDTTGSMGGVINDVKASIGQLLATLRAGGGNPRVGIVAYRDVDDAYVVSPLPLTELNGPGGAAIDSFVASLQAHGGGDWPEKVDAAIQAAASMDWRRGVPASIVVIGDAPAHPGDQEAAFKAARDFQSATGGHLSTVDSGSGAHAFMAALPEAAGGQYITYDGNILKSLYPAITGCASK